MAEGEITAERVFQYVLEEILRDANVSDLELMTINEVKQALQITSEQHQRAHQAAIKALKERGRMAEYELVPEDVFRRIAARACMDGQISDAEMKILETVSRALKVDPTEHYAIWKAVEETSRKSRQG
jgi:tellurite resistance protein